MKLYGETLFVFLHGLESLNFTVKLHSLDKTLKGIAKHCKPYVFPQSDIVYENYYTALITLLIYNYLNLICCRYIIAASVLHVIHFLISKN